MDSEDEFNQFVLDEVINSSSSPRKKKSSSSDDDENDLFYGAAHMIIEDSVNHPGRTGSIEGMRYWIVKDYYTTIFFTNTISPIILRSKKKLLDGGSHVFSIICI
jgi:hypothetical protein